LGIGSCLFDAETDSKVRWSPEYRIVFNVLSASAEFPAPIRHSNITQCLSSGALDQFSMTFKGILSVFESDFDEDTLFHHDV
jgi:hypothetical protein